jgi:hypothetical protein
MDQMDGNTSGGGSGSKNVSMPVPHPASQSTTHTHLQQHNPLSQSWPTISADHSVTKGAVGSVGGDGRRTPYPDSSSARGGVASSSGGGGGGGFLGLGALKRAAAATANQLTTNIVEGLARMPVQLVVDVTHFEGTLMLWLGPPPSDR